VKSSLLALARFALPLFVAALPFRAAAGPPEAADDRASEDAPRQPTELERRASAGREAVGVLRLRSDQIHEWLREARRARYGGRTACLDDSLSQSHALERQGDEALSRAERAAQADNARAVERELVRIQVLDGLSQSLLGSARNCGRAPTRAAPPRRTR
jgi:hypothetical protein